MCLHSLAPPLFTSLLCTVMLYLDQPYTLYVSDADNSWGTSMFMSYQQWSNRAKLCGQHNFQRFCELLNEMLSELNSDLHTHKRTEKCFLHCSCLVTCDCRDADPNVEKCSISTPWPWSFLASVWVDFHSSLVVGMHAMRDKKILRFIVDPF